MMLEQADKTLPNHSRGSQNSNFNFLHDHYWGGLNPP
jgi:hypothetical protein